MNEVKTNIELKEMRWMMREREHLICLEYLPSVLYFDSCFVTIRIALAQSNIRLRKLALVFKLEVKLLRKAKMIISKTMFASS